MHRSSISRVAARGLLVALLALTGLVATALPVSAQAAEPAPAGGAYPANGRVTVRQGDTLYSIARRTLGDGSRYTEIFDLNEGVAQADGGRLTDPSTLRVGWVLRLPEPEGPGDPDPLPEPDPDDSAGSGRTYTVRSGDSLSSIARSQLGDASRFDEIFAINQGRPQVGGGSLTDPGILRIGWVLELPRRNGGGPTTPTTPPAGGRRYTVVTGDSLSSIAREQLGSAGRYLEIFELNEGVPQAVGGSLTNPSVLRVGWVLRLPSGSGGGATPPTNPGAARRYTVAVGDTLSSIARAQLGSAARFTEIYDLNKGRPQAVGGTLTDPSVLRVGWVLRLPAR
jgi:nucleoid-associated protein YgaU